MLTNRERTIAGFGWMAARSGSSMSELGELLDVAEALGGFDVALVDRAAAGKISEKEALEVMQKNIDDSRKAGA